MKCVPDKRVQPLNVKTYTHAEATNFQSVLSFLHTDVYIDKSIFFIHTVPCLFIWQESSTFHVYPETFHTYSLQSPTFL